MYDCIRDQWNWGCYTSRDQLDVYVNAGWITADQADQIAQVGKYAPQADSISSTATTTNTSATTA